MSVPTSLEKIFFAYILENPHFVQTVNADHFENPQIKYIYNIVKKNVVGSNSRIIPSPHQIKEMVRLDDPAGEKVSNEVLKAVLKTNLDQYQQTAEDKWLDDKFKSWTINNGLRESIFSAVTELRSLDQDVDIEKSVETYEKIKKIVGESNLLANFDNDLGSDFDDVDAHEQDTNLNKVKTNYTNLDDLLNGGYDRKTLNLLMAPSGVGKSMWMCNIAAQMANLGKNVLYVSLEMSEKKVMKRVGSVRLKIPIAEYDVLSKDKNFMKQKLAELHHGFTKGADMFDHKIGKFIVKEYPAGTASVYDLDDFVKKYQEVTGVKIDVIFVDYLTIMNPGTKDGSLYTNGKALAEGLRAIAQKYNLVMISAMQVAKDAIDANDMSAKDISESKAILETADTLFGIIQIPQMKKEGNYYLKAIKLRDGEYKWLKCRFKFDKRYVTIQNDEIIE